MAGQEKNLGIVKIERIDNSLLTFMVIHQIDGSGFENG